MVTFAAMALSFQSGLAPARMNIREHRQMVIVKKKDQSVVAKLEIYERDSCSRDARARRDVGTLRLSGQGFPKVSGQVLADIRRHFQHVDAGNRHDGFQSSIRLDGASVIELVLL